MSAEPAEWIEWRSVDNVSDAVVDPDDVVLENTSSGKALTTGKISVAAFTNPSPQLRQVPIDPIFEFFPFAYVTTCSQVKREFRKEFKVKFKACHHLLL